MEIKILRIRDVSDETINKIKSIAKDKCETTTQTIKPIIREIADSFDDGVFIESEKSELQIHGVSASVCKKIENRAKKIGITTDQLLRLKLYEWLENQPDFIRSLY